MRVSIDKPSADLGITIDRFGRIEWIETAGRGGLEHTVEVRVSDGRTNGDDVGSVLIQVDEDQTAPKVVLQADPAAPVVGDVVTFAVLAVDNVGVVSRTLTVNGTPLALDDRGLARYTIPQAGSAPRRPRRRTFRETSRRRRS